MNSHMIRGALMGLALTALMTVGASAAYTGVATVTCDKLNFRAEPTTESAAIGSAKLDDTVLVVEKTDDNWYKVDYCTIQGYMHADWLSVSDDWAKPICYGKVDTEGSSLNLRATPSTSGKKLASIPADTVLPLMAMENGWFKVEYKDTEGYVSGEFILATDSKGCRADEKTPDTPAKAPETTASASELGEQIVAYSKKFLGVPYVYGANGPKSFDCSGFTSYVYKHFGYSLNRSAAGQLSNGRAVSESEMQVGDIICWRAYGSSKAATHVGIYIGNNQYIHASTTGKIVRISELGTSTSRYVVGVRRII